MRNKEVNIAKFVDIICPEVPKVAQILDERHGQVFARVPLERHFSGSMDGIIRDKQAKIFHRKQNYFNPISIKKTQLLKYTKHQDDDDYVLLQPDAKWYMILEIANGECKRKPKNRELQILQALEKLLVKIDTLNQKCTKITG